MPYLYGRSKGLVDLLVEKNPRTRIQINAGAYTQETSYTVVVNGHTYTHVVTSEVGNDSEIIAAALEALIIPNEAELGVKVLRLTDSLFIRSTNLNDILNISAYVSNTDNTITISQVFPEKIHIHADLGAGPETVASFGIDGGKSFSLSYDPLRGSGTNFRPWVRYRFNPVDLGLDDLNDFEVQLAYEFHGNVESLGQPFTIEPQPVWRLLDGIYVGSKFTEEANGWYEQNFPKMVPNGIWSNGQLQDQIDDGVWSLGINTGLAQGLYDNNVKITMQDGLYVGEAYVGEANGYYVNNVSANIPNGSYQGGIKVDLAIEKVLATAPHTLIQFKYAKYKGIQYLWKDAAGTSPVTAPGDPIGRVDAIGGSGRYLVQEVETKRPTWLGEGLGASFDGTDDIMYANDNTMGGHLHNVASGGYFVGLEILTYTADRVILSTGQGLAGNNAFELSNTTSGVNTPGIAERKRSETINRTTVTGYDINITKNGLYNVVGGTFEETIKRLYKSGVTIKNQSQSFYPNTVADHVLALGGQTATGAQNLHARITYLVIYNREVTDADLEAQR